LITRRPAAAAKVLVLAFIVLTLVMATAMGPCFAVGDEAKHPIPSIAKSVSLDGAEWSEEASTDAGGTVRYRLVMTMSESATSDSRAEYRVLDTSDAAVEADASTLRACIANENGTVKAIVEPSVSLQGRTLAIDLGDLKKACPNLAYGDLAIVEYEAHVSGSARPGSYQNVARLVYDLGSGPEETVGARALVRIAESEDTAAGSIPKTGDGLPPWLATVLAALTLIAASLMTVAARPVPERRIGGPPRHRNRQRPKRRGCIWKGKENGTEKEL